MLTQKTRLALLLTTFTAAAIGCGGSSTRKITTGTGGTGGQGGETTGVAGSGGSTAGTAGTDAGTTGTAGGTAGQAGGTAGMDASVDSPPDTVVEMAPPYMADGSQDVSYTFDTDTQMWAFTGYGSTPLVPGPTNLAMTSALSWDSADDADGRTTGANLEAGTASGSLKGSVLFRNPGDQIDFQAFSVAAGKFNWLGYKISAKVKLVSGGNIATGCPLSAWLYVSGPAPGYQTTPVSPTVNLVTGSWVTITFDLALAAGGGIDVTAVSQMGIQITTGPACTATAPVDGGVDAVTGGDAGTDGAATEGGTADGGTDGAATEGGTDGAATEGGTADGGTDASEGGDAVVPPPPPTATTAVILIDDVIVTVE